MKIKLNVKGDNTIAKSMIIDLFTDTAAILNSEEIMGCPGGR